jgi:hypothetical protein
VLLSPAAGAGLVGCASGEERENNGGLMVLVCKEVLWVV